MGYVSNAAAIYFPSLNACTCWRRTFSSTTTTLRRGKNDADPTIKADFHSHLAKADALANAALAKNPKDTDALFAEVLADGLRCDYAALIEKRNIASLAIYEGCARWTTNYSPSTPRATTLICHWARRIICWARTRACPMGAQPDRVQDHKQQGIEQLRIVAEKGHYLAPFARLLLAVAALRDKDKHTAKVLLAGLATEFPDNKLYSKELSRIQSGSAALRRSGRVECQ